MGDEVTVTVEDNDEPDESAPVVVAPVIVNEAPAESSTESSTDVDLAVTVGALVATVGTLAEKVDSLTAQQEVTEITASTALDVAIAAEEDAEVVAEEEDIPEDELPGNALPWTHRPAPWKR